MVYMSKLLKFSLFVTISFIEFSYPTCPLFGHYYDVAIDPKNGNFVAAEPLHHKVVVFNENGDYLFQFGKFGRHMESPDKFNFFHGIAIDPINSDIIVSDTWNNLVKVFNSHGKFKFKIGFARSWDNSGSGPGQFEWPIKVAIDPNNKHIVVADYLNHRVQVFNLQGSFLFEFGGYGPEAGRFNHPSYVAINPINSDIAVVDQENYRIQIFDKNGKYLFDFGSHGTSDEQFTFPCGVAYDPRNGNIVITNRIIYKKDEGNNRIQVFDSNGKFLYKFGENGTGIGLLSDPHGIAINPDTGNIAVADFRAKNIKVFDSEGNFIFEFGEYETEPGLIRSK